jgi:hypothetical protein
MHRASTIRICGLARKETKASEKGQLLSAVFSVLSLVSIRGGGWAVWVYIHIPLLLRRGRPIPKRDGVSQAMTPARGS